MLGDCHSVGKENTWERKMYLDVTGIQPEATTIYGDNTASISLLSTGVTKRSRHFDIEWFKVHDMVEAGEFKISWVPTEENFADFFTKKLPREKFQYLREKLMGGEKLQLYFKNDPVCKMMAVENDECRSDMVSASGDVMDLG